MVVSLKLNDPTTQGPLVRNFLLATSPLLLLRHKRATASIC